MHFEDIMANKYGKIQTIIDIERALSSDNFIKEYADELRLIIETTIDPSEKDTYIYDVNDATIVGLFTKLYKYFKLTLSAYEDGQYDTTVLISRPLYEAFVIMKYLILNGENSQRHFRLVSYRRRFEKMQELEQVGAISHVMLEKFKHGMEIDGFKIEDFKEEKNKQKGNGKKWELDGKNFSEIQKAVEDSRTYPYVYGMLSDVIHSGWGDIRQMHLNWCEGNQAVPKMEFYKSTDIRIVVPIFSIMIEATEKYLIWHQRESEIVFVKEHKRIDKLLSEYIFKNYEETPEKYIFN